LKGLAFTETSLGLAMVLQNRQAEAVPHFRKALELDPDQTLACNELAWILATHKDPTVRNGADAVRFAEHACNLTQWKRLEFIGTLDAALAEAGRFDEAIAMARKLIARAEKEGRPFLAGIAAERIALYESG